MCSIRRSPSTCLLTDTWLENVAYPWMLIVMSSHHTPVLFTFSSRSSPLPR